MRRRARAWLTAAAAVTALAGALAGCGQSSNTTSSGAGASGTMPPPSSSTATTTTTSTAPTTPSGGSGLSVTPAVGSPHSVIHFAFTPPYATGVHGSTEISSALSVQGPQHSGCVGVHGQALPALPVAQAASVAVGPAQLGGPWCPGDYTARVEVVARPKCGQGQMCPQFIRVMKILGPVRFRISG